MHFYGTATLNAQGHLVIGGCDTVELAREFGTPLYVFDEALLRRNLRAYVSAFKELGWADADICYASKAFLCTAMAALAYQEGLSLDVVSGGEIYTALAAGVPAARLYFHGNNKSPDEVEYALNVGVGRIIVDSLDELEMVAGLASRLGKKASIMFRCTPGVEAHTHHYISTGQLDSKFGLAIEGGIALGAVKRALQLGSVELKGLHCHIGSQIFDLTGPALAAERMVDFMAVVKKETGFTVGELNLGGGLGVRYTAADSPTTPRHLVGILSDSVRGKLAEHNLPTPRLIVEPGRSIVGEAGTTLYTIGTVKTVPGVRTYVSVDGGMTDNPRPALYQAKYEAVVANKVGAAQTQKVSIAGKCCESGDMLIWDIELPAVQRGDILAVFTTGAYNYAMASHYNRFPKPAVVFVMDGKAEVVVRRETYADVAACDVLPPRLAVQ